MPFLRRRSDTEPARAWWTAVELYPSAAPGLVRELARSESVVADSLEIQQAAGWARAHPAWRDEDPPFVAQEGVIAR
ncbi:MAG TPA: hypothetical protein VE198_13855 [Actinoallomurus sp.]|nr:hypothetical protein [Actinoallomurus sp.]